MPPKRMIGRAVVILCLAAAAGVYCVVHFGRRGEQDYDTLSAVLRPRFAGWTVAREPDLPGPYRIPAPYRTPAGTPLPLAGPGKPLVGTFGSPRGQIRYDVPASPGEEQVFVPLETADGRLTYAVIRHEVAGKKP